MYWKRKNLTNSVKSFVLPLQKGINPHRASGTTQKLSATTTSSGEFYRPQFTINAFQHRFRNLNF